MADYKRIGLLLDPANHPPGTTYDTLVPSHAARVRGGTWEQAVHAYRVMTSEGLEPLVVAHLPDGTRCYPVVG